MNTDEYFTPVEVARRLRVDYTTVMRWISSGVLESEKIQQGGCNRWRVKKSMIEAIERRHEHTPLV
jgi:excisionase family DNA binding protein